MRRKEDNTLVSSTEGSDDILELLVTKTEKEITQKQYTKNIIFWKKYNHYSKKLINIFSSNFSKNEDYDNILTDNENQGEKLLQKNSFNPIVLKDEVVNHFVNIFSNKDDFNFLKNQYENLIPRNIRKNFEKLIFSQKRDIPYKDRVIDFFYKKLQSENMDLNVFCDELGELKIFLFDLLDGKVFLDNFSDVENVGIKKIFTWLIEFSNYTKILEGDNSSILDLETIISSSDINSIEILCETFFNDPEGSIVDLKVETILDQVRFAMKRGQNESWRTYIEDEIISSNSLVGEIKTFIPKMLFEISTLLFLLSSFNTEEKTFRKNLREQVEPLNNLATILFRNSNEIILDNKKSYDFTNWMGELLNLLNRVLYFPFTTAHNDKEYQIIYNTWELFFKQVSDKTLFLNHFSQYPNKLQKLFIYTIDSEINKESDLSLKFDNSLRNSKIGFNYKLFSNVVGSSNQTLANVVAHWLIIKYPPFFKKSVDLDNGVLEFKDFLFFDGEEYIQDTEGFLNEKVIDSAIKDPNGTKNTSFCPDKTFINEVLNNIKEIFKRSKNNKEEYIYSEDNVLSSQIYSENLGAKKFLFRFNNVYVIIGDYKWKILKNSQNVFIPVKLGINIKPNKDFLKEELINNEFIDDEDLSLKTKYIQSFILDPSKFLNNEKLKEYNLSYSAFSKYLKTITNGNKDFEKALLLQAFEALTYGNKSRFIYTFIGDSDGNSGKTTYGKIFLRFMNEINGAFLDWNQIFGKTNNEFQQSSMVGKNVLLFEELPQVMDENVDLIKTLTDENNTKLINRKFQTPKFENIFATMIAFSNFLPNFGKSESSHAIYNRFKLLKWRADQFIDVKKKTLDAIIEEFNGSFWKLVFLKKILEVGCEFYGWNISPEELDGENIINYSIKNNIQNCYTLPFYDFKETNKLTEEMIVLNKMEDKFLFKNKALYNQEVSKVLIKIKGMRENFDYYITKSGSIEWMVEGKKRLQSLLYNLTSVSSVNTQYSTYVKFSKTYKDDRFSGVVMNSFLEKHLTSLYSLEIKEKMVSELDKNKFIFLSKSFIKEYLKWRFPNFEIDEKEAQEKSDWETDISTSSIISNERLKDFEDFYFSNLIDFSKLENQNSLEKRKINETEERLFLKQDSNEYLIMKRIFQDLQNTDDTFMENNFNIKIEYNNYKKPFTNNTSNELDYDKVVQSISKGVKDF